ncbi:glycosyltransferase family 2 protein [Dongia deserti]|uniref:glycosyltransferase family 2 protein n=1 Tax=Dongia deserti TaxID=2268030 RepID=UPI0013C50A93|nr:glycosyltransferase family A protein [Dongia deserti]
MNGCDPSVENQSNPACSQQVELQYLADIIMSEGAARNAPSDPVRAQLSACMAAWRPALERPLDLAGRDCALPAPQWHWQRLLEHVGNGEKRESDLDRARRLYHARWLAHLLAPERAEYQPRVTILIPVFNRAAMAIEAVESCLAQDCKALEILVVDDGSTDDLAGALARFGGAVRLHRQPNGGVSSARNAGIRLATGDFIHFLDSDNLLLPKAVSRKIEAFAHFADAELCYSLAVMKGARAADLPPVIRPGSGPGCPTISLLNCGHPHPFYVSCVMLPRFTLLSAGGFEEDLQRGEDTRLWSKLALREIKVIGLDAELTVRRLSEATLSATPIEPSLHFAIRARMIADFLGSSRAWRRARKTYRATLPLVLGDGARGPLSPVPERDLANLLAAISALGTGVRPEGVSPLPLLAYLRHVTSGSLVARSARHRDGTDLLGTLYATIDRAARRAARLTPPDLAFWAEAATLDRSVGRFQSFIDKSRRLIASDPAALSVIDELLRSASLIPGKRAFRTYLRLRRWKVPRWVSLKLIERWPS